MFYATTGSPFPTPLVENWGWCSHLKSCRTTWNNPKNRLSPAVMVGVERSAQALAPLAADDSDLQFIFQFPSTRRKAAGRKSRLIRPRHGVSSPAASQPISLTGEPLQQKLKSD